MVSRAPVSWKSKKQTCVALSTAEAEYVTLAYAAQEVVFLRELFKDLLHKQTESTIIHEDNQAAIWLVESPQYHSKTKHIDIKYHYVCEKVLDNTIKLNYCPTNKMLANMLNKGLSKDKFAGLRKMTEITEMSACK